MLNREERAAWRIARRAAIARDGACRKCLARTLLEVHHIIERVYGGTNDLDNLITLCTHCHAEWTWCQPATLDFETWRGLPPARFVVPLFASEWPTDISAEEFRQRFLTGLAMLFNQRPR